MFQGIRYRKRPHPADRADGKPPLIGINVGRPMALFVSGARKNNHATLCCCARRQDNQNSNKERLDGSTDVQFLRQKEVDDVVLQGVPDALLRRLCGGRIYKFHMSKGAS